MSVTSGFFNSVNGDRRYSAEQMSSLFDGIINDGVFASIGTAFEVKAKSGKTVTVGLGRAWFNSIWVDNDAILSITANDAEILLSRYDAIVIEINHTSAVRAGTIKYIKGTASSNPQKPTMANTNEIHQYPLAYIYRPAGSTEITQSNITNCVGTSSCPYITGILQVQNIDKNVAQWEAQFNEWFDRMQDQLSEDAVGNLQKQIDDIEKNYLPLSGGTLTGGLYTKGNIGTDKGNEAASVSAKNSTRYLSLTVNAKGYGGLYDNTYGSWLVHTNTDGRVTLARVAVLNGLLTFARSCEAGITPFSINSNTDTSEGIPPSAICSGFVNARTADMGSILLVSTATQKMYLATYSSATTVLNFKEMAYSSDLANYLPLSGGTLSGDITLSNAKPFNSINIENGRRKISLHLSATDKMGLWDGGKDEWIIYSDTDGHVRTPSHLTAGGMTADGYIYQNSFNNQLIMGAQNATYCHFTSSNQPFYFNQKMYSAYGKVLTADDFVVTGSANEATLTINLD